MYMILHFLVQEWGYNLELEPSPETILALVFSTDP